MYKYVSLSQRIHLAGVHFLVLSLHYLGQDIEHRLLGLVASAFTH